jgi:hypothetical protein
MTHPIVATAASAVDFMVQRADLHVCKFESASLPTERDLLRGQVLLKIAKFAFTSNNVTYAAFGESMAYWSFFPAPDGWGRIPVWGFADVVYSRSDGVLPGERFYGYFPMSSHLVVQPDHCSDAGFLDAMPHRQKMHPLYNQYLRTATDPAYSATSEDEQMLLRPLFITSFMIDDFLADKDFFGAQMVVISSASSKTAYGLAFLLAMRGHSAIEVVGLTSAANVDFVDGLDCYDRVLSYEAAGTLANTTPVVYVDMAGNGQLRATLHHHFGRNMKYSCAVGGTHWNALLGEGGGADLPGARPILFFAPSQIKKRTQEWGFSGMQERVAAAWLKFMASVMHPTKGWMRVVQGRGPDAVKQVYLAMLEGRAKPDEGNVLSLSE